MSPRFAIIEAAQRTPEWVAARAGRLTGSRAHCVLTKPKKGADESVMRRDYRLQLVSERITGQAQESFFWSDDMQRGVDLEPVAFAMYEAQYGHMVRKTGFLQHTEYMAGCSLDGDINEFSGIIELKCPKMATHLTYLKKPNTLYDDYAAQVRHNLWITGAAWCDLISFDDRLPKPIQMMRLRCERYDVDVPGYQIEALKFLSEVENEYQQIMDGVYV